MSASGVLPSRYDTAQKWEWTLQRIAWLVWGGVLVAGLAGLLGPGPLSSTEVASEGGTTRVLLDRYVHYSSAATLEVVVEPSGPTEELSVEISHTLLESMKIQRIEPQPIRSTVRGESVEYWFHRAPDAAPSRVTFHVEFDTYGKVSGSIGSQGDEGVAVELFVFP